VERTQVLGLAVRGESGARHQAIAGAGRLRATGQRSLRCWFIRRLASPADRPSPRDFDHLHLCSSPHVLPNPVSARSLEVICSRFYSSARCRRIRSRTPRRSLGQCHNPIAVVPPGASIEMPGKGSPLGLRQRAKRGGGRPERRTGDLDADLRLWASSHVMRRLWAAGWVVYARLVRGDVFSVEPPGLAVLRGRDRHQGSRLRCLWPSC
jgi:hypothetical protein